METTLSKIDQATLDRGGTKLTACKISTLIEQLRKQLPIQNPLPTFVHNNILLHFEHMPFHKAVTEAAFFYGARPYCSEEFYRNALATGRISTKVLEEVIRSDIQEEIAPEPLRVHQVWEKVFGLPFTRTIHDFLIPILSTYLDQGQSPIPNPFRKRGIWAFFKAQIQHRPAFARHWLPKEIPSQVSDELIVELLEANDFTQDEATRYCLELLFDLKGWSGMINKLETEPEQAPADAPEIRLKEWLAVRLVCENALNETYLKRSNVTSAVLHKKRDALNAKSFEKEGAPRFPFAAWHEAYEQTYLSDELKRLSPHFKAIREHAPVAIHQPSAQVLFCIDDREESLRRHLESVAPCIETFGVVGFFNVDMELHAPTPKGTVPAKPRAQCPPVIRPSRKVFQKSDGSYLYDGPDGYSVAECAKIVASVLRMCGITHRFNELIVVLSHGSTSTNNPFIQAYGCGACGGNPGYANAKVFSAMANRSDVRALLRETENTSIPSNTRFVAAYHDTCTDEVVYESPVSADLERAFKSAGALNANERCLHFESFQGKRSVASSFRHVKMRSRDLSQPRPEYGHSRVALCVVGRRDLTQGLNLDRRSFLVTYDPTTDPDGSVLRDVVLGAVPVCANISLDYFFSRIDNDGFGAGTKLPLNVTSRLGVMTGSKSDLRIGLAGQMVEIHEPMRIIVLIEADLTLLKKLMSSHPRLRNLVVNEWMRLGHIDPLTGKTTLLSGVDLWTTS